MSALSPTATLIDVREYPEFATAHIPGSTSVPLSTLPQAASTWPRDREILLICKAGGRAQKAQAQLTALGFTRTEVLPGGMDAWQTATQPTTSLARRPWSLERQVRFGAGGLVLLTLALATTLTHYFLFATAFIGAGLVFAGATDICMMATVLSKLPWNQRPRTTA